MTDAIQVAIASPPPWDEVGTQPSLPGLRRRRLAPLDVLAPSLAAAKPAATALIAPTLLTAYVGRGAWLSIVVAVAGALLLRSVIGEFTSRVVTAGSLYTFVVRSLGAWAGLVTAAAMLLGYGFASGYALTSSGLAARALMTRQTGAATGFGLADALVVLGLGLVCGLVLLRRVSTFTVVTLAIQVATVAAVVVLVVLVAVQDRDVDGALTLAGADPLRVAGGATVMLALLVGFECSASLGAEAARPYRSVPRAMVTSILVTGALCLLTTFVLAADPAVSLDALHRSVRIDQLWFPGGHGTITLYRWTRILSLTACTLAVWAAMTRLVFTLALEGALPSRLARTHPRFQTPWLAVAVTAPLVIGPGVLLVATDHSLQIVAATLLDSTGLLMLLAYLLTCLAVPVFLARLGELTPRSATTAAVTALMVGAAIASNLSWQEYRNDTGTVWVLAAGILPLATTWYVVLRRRRGALAALGIHDQTIASDAWCDARSGSGR